MTILDVFQTIKESGHTWHRDKQGHVRNEEGLLPSAAVWGTERPFLALHALGLSTHDCCMLSQLEHWGHPGSRSLWGSFVHAVGLDALVDEPYQHVPRFARGERISL